MLVYQRVNLFCGVVTWGVAETSGCRENSEALTSADLWHVVQDLVPAKLGGLTRQQGDWARK